MTRGQTLVLVLLGLGVCLVFGAWGFLLFNYSTSGPPSTSVAQATPALPPETLTPGTPTKAVTPSRATPTNTSIVPLLSTPTPSDMQKIAPLPTLPAIPGVISVSRCGIYDVTQLVGLSAGSRVTSITISDAQGQAVKTFKANPAVGEGLRVLWCVDLTASGTPALVIESFSGGAHCCSTFDVIVMDESLANLLHREAGSGSMYEVALLSRQPPYEMIGSDDRFANFHDLPFLASPFLPAVFAFRDGKYVLATRDYPQILRDDQARAQQRLGQCKDDEFCQKGAALQILGDGVWLKEEAQTLTKLKTQVKPTVATWLDSVRADALKVLAK